MLNHNDLQRWNPGVCGKAGGANLADGPRVGPAGRDAGQQTSKWAKQKSANNFGMHRRKTVVDEKRRMVGEPSGRQH